MRARAGNGDGVGTTTAAGAAVGALLAAGAVGAAGGGALLAGRLGLLGDAQAANRASAASAPARCRLRSRTARRLLLRPARVAPMARSPPGRWRPTALGSAGSRKSHC